MRTVFVKISPGTIKRQAQRLARVLFKEARSRDVWLLFPRITPLWVRLWRREYHVSLRTPNRRWKVSRNVCLERCRITWLNVYRVRRLCELEHGFSPALDGWDQKPFHFNE